MRTIESDAGEWFALHQTGDRIRCCDCGLVHNVEFSRKGKVRLRVWRNERATAAVRRSNKVR